MKQCSARDHHQTEEGRNVNRVGTEIIDNNPQAGAGDGTARGPVIPKPHHVEKYTSLEDVTTDARRVESHTEKNSVG